jgi:hypothetical protein
MEQSIYLPVNGVLKRVSVESYDIVRDYFRTKGIEPTNEQVYELCLDVERELGIRAAAQMFLENLD